MGAADDLADGFEGILAVVAAGENLRHILERALAVDSAKKLAVTGVDIADWDTPYPHGHTPLLAVAELAMAEDSGEE